jgi:predicted nucleotidyltransferase
MGYAFEAGGEPFVDLEDEETLARVVANGACLTAIHPDAGQIDLMTSLAGFSYAELERDATPFRVAGVEVRVGQLEKLLRSKERSGRPKDVEFLRAFEARAAEEGED